MTKIRAYALASPRSAFPFALVLASLAGSGCSSDEPPRTTTTPLSTKYRRLGDNLGQAIARAKSNATSPITLTAASFGAVAAIPKDVVGDVDLSAEQRGKSGERTIDVDAIGAEETVRVFVPDAPTSGTAATQPSFVAWKGDADSNDEGLCYLAWTKGASWFVASRCGDTSSAWVCQVTSSEATCDVCDASGACAPCDMDQSTFTCAAR